MRELERDRSRAEDDLRIRLEGTYELLERARDRYAHAEGLLKKARFRTALRSEPELFDELLEKEPQVHGGLEKAEAFLLRTPSDELRRLLEQVRARRAAVHQLASRRLKAKAALPFEEALQTLHRRVFAELPGEPQPGEKRLAEVKAGLHPALAGLIAFWLSASLSGLTISALPSVSPAIVTLAQSSLAVAVGVFWAVTRSGVFTLTNRRMIWRPRFGEPSQVELKALKPSDIRRGFTSLRVNALVPFKVRGLSRARELGSRIDALRFVQSQPRGESEVDAAVFPAEAGEIGFYGDGININAGVALMRPSYAVFLHSSRSDRVMNELTGYVGRAQVDLMAALQILKELPEAKFDELVRAAADKHGVLLDRSAGAAIKTNGPVWQHLVVSDGRKAFNTRITWRHLEEVERMVAKWRKWEG